MEKRKWLTATNILILIIIFCYILDRYIIPIPIGYEGWTWEAEAEGVPEIVVKVLGFCGGRLTDALALLGSEINPNGHMFYRYITVVFTHSFIIHLAVNMVALYFVGNFVEEKIGSRLTLILFFSTGIIEAVITDPMYLMYNSSYDMNTAVCAGASGAVFGLMGVGLIICLFNRDKFKSMKLSHKIVLALYGIIFTYLANGELISWTTFAHNNGFIVGIIIMLIVYFSNTKIKEKVQN